MSNALQALLYPFDTGQSAPLAQGDRILFLNALYSPALSAHDVTYIQPFIAYALEIEQALPGVRVRAEVPEESPRDYDVVFVLLPKNRVEAEYLLAQGLLHVRAGGRLVCAADNKAGGSNIGKMLKNFGFADVEIYSKYKARCAVVAKSEAALDTNAVDKALASGARQNVLEGTYVSMPGIYGWNKIDRGSSILAEYLPDDISGIVADFGCGYGYLSSQVAQHCPAISMLYMLDADARALSCAQANLEGVRPGLGVQALWTDLTIAHDAFADQFDVIVMNPPFHEGKKTDIGVGISFIECAHTALKKDGRLYMVANTHLPYEHVLQTLFKNVRKMYEGGGFKVFEAFV